jgi:hypothetical protein
MKTGTFLVGAGILAVVGGVLYATRERKLPCGPHGYGDVNDDGLMDLGDISAAGLVMDGYEEFFPPGAYERADVDGDGVVTQNDLNLIELYILGYISKFPVC